VVGKTFSWTSEDDPRDRPAPLRSGAVTQDADAIGANGGDDFRVPGSGDSVTVAPGQGPKPDADALLIGLQPESR